jgi:hypothetical protein
MSDEPETDEAEGEGDGTIGVQIPDPISLSSPEGVTYVITDEGALCESLGVDSVMAYRATDQGLEWLTEKRRWEPVEAAASAPRVVSARKN